MEKKVKSELYNLVQKWLKWSLEKQDEIFNST